MRIIVLLLAFGCHLGLINNVPGNNIDSKPSLIDHFIFAQSLSSDTLITGTVFFEKKGEDFLYIRVIVDEVHKGKVQLDSVVLSVNPEWEKRISSRSKYLIGIVGDIDSPLSITFTYTTILRAKSLSYWQDYAEDIRSNDEVNDAVAIYFESEVRRSWRNYWMEHIESGNLYVLKLAYDELSKRQLPASQEEPSAIWETTIIPYLGREDQEVLRKKIEEAKQRGVNFDNEGIPLH